MTRQQRLLSCASLLALLATSPARAQSFVAAGPAPIADPAGTSGLGILLNGSAVAGAVGPIVTSPSDPGRIWVGGVNGGVWSSTNGGTSWTALTDHLPTLSIGALALDPTSPTANPTLVAGFGNFSNAAGVGGALDGLVMSNDGGANWHAIGGNALNGHMISGITVDGPVILAAASGANGGLFRSQNGGQSFSPVPAIQGSVTSLAFDPADPARVYAAVAQGAGSTVYVSKNGGAEWSAFFTAANSGGVVNDGTQLLRLGTGPDGSVAVGIANGRQDGLAAAGVFLYDAASGKWTPLTMPSVAVRADRPNGPHFGINPGNQAETNFAVAIDPRNPGIVYVSGDRQELPQSGDGGQDEQAPSNEPANGLGARQYTATVFRLERNADGTNSFTALTNDFAANGTAPHADTRFISFDANGNLLLSADGGIYRRSLPETSTGAWTGLNNGLQLLEAYKAAYDPTTGSILAAAQDNGTEMQPKPGSLSWASTAGGDGFNLGVNATSRPGLSALYFGVNGASIIRYAVPPSGIATGQAGLNFTVGKQDIATYEGLKELPLSSQFVLNRVAPESFALGTNRVYVGTDPFSTNYAAKGTIDTPVTELYRAAEPDAFVNTLAYGTRDNPGALLALFYRSATQVVVSLAPTPAPGTMHPAAGWSSPNAPIAAVFDPRSANHFYISDTQSIFGTANGGDSFTRINGNLPDTFANIRALEFLSSGGVNALFAGGQNNVVNAGSPIYVAQASNLTNWSAFGNGLPNAIVDGLSYNDQGDVLVVATLGRGVYALYDVTSFFPTATVLNFGAANNDSLPIASQLTDGVDANGNAFSRGLQKNGTGTLTIAVPSTYTGATSVNAGVMRAAAPNVFAPTSAFTVSSLLDLGGYNQAIGSLAGNGFVNLGTGFLTTGGNNQSTSFAGMIMGPGGVTKTGSGTFTLTGSNPYTGATTVAAGTLALTATAAVGGSVAVQPGATLADGGTIGGSLASAGNVVLAASGTRVNLGGGLTLLPGGTLSVPVAQSGPSGGIAAGGAASLGGTLQLVASPGSPVLHDNAIVTAPGGVSGQFAAVTGEAPGRQFALNYTGTTVQLVPLPDGLTGLAATGNERGVATALDALVQGNGGLSLDNLLAASPMSQVPGILAGLSGAGYTALEQNAVSATHIFQDMMAARLSAMATGLPVNDAGAVVGQVAPAGDPLGFGTLIAAAGTIATDAQAPVRSDLTVRPWIASYGRFDHLDGTAATPGMQSDGGALVLGADLPVHLNFTDRAGAGAAFAYDFADINAPGVTSAHQQAYRGSLYGWLGLGAAWVGGSLDYSHMSAQASRLVGFGFDRGVSSVSPAGNSFSGQVIAARPVAVGGFSLMPQIRLQGLAYGQDGFTEAGQTGAELNIASRDRGSLWSVLGVSAARPIALTSGPVITPQLGIGWAHEFLDPAARLRANFVAGGPGFGTEGTTPGRDSVLAGASLAARFGRASVFLAYDLEAASRETIQAVTAGARLTW